MDKCVRANLIQIKVHDDGGLERIAARGRDIDQIVPKNSILEGSHKVPDVQRRGGDMLGRCNVALGGHGIVLSRRGAVVIIAGSLHFILHLNVFFTLRI